MHLPQQTKSGFTLIELIVSLALFSVVVTISVGALMTLIASNQQLQDEQSVMTNLSFALDSMTREIRTGTRYFCGGGSNTNELVSFKQIFKDDEVLSMGKATRDCWDGNTGTGHVIQGIAFIEGGQSITNSPDTRIVYYYDADKQKIFRRISGGKAQSIVSSGLVITDAEFYVSGGSPLGTGDKIQPTVTIFIEAREAGDSNAKPYRIQTTVTQRTLDI